MIEESPNFPSEAEQAYAMALKAAEGIDCTRDWARALDYLERAAVSGSLLARAQLAGLSGEWRLAYGILAEEVEREWPWPRLRNAIDLERWLKPAPKPVPAELPRMAAVEGIAEPELCDWLINRARRGLKPALVYDRKKNEHVSSEIRTNSFCPFRGPDSDIFLAILRARIAEVTDTQGHTMESPSVLHYLVGQEFRPHFDIILKPDSPDYAQKFAEGGQRMLTFLLSLNDDYEGGETEFPVIGKLWRGRKGSGLFFWSVGPDGALDRRMLHAGLPLTSGEKWVLSQWIRGRPARPAAGA